jgi:hypothetical protein
MAEAAKGINPEIAPEEVTEELKEIVTEVKEVVKEAPAEVVDKLLPRNKPQLVSLRETVSREGFDDKRGWPRILALWGSTNSPFFR